MGKKSARKSILTIAAIVAAVVGAAVAVGVFLKKKATTIGEQLDYDGSIYYEDDDYCQEEEAEEQPAEPAESSQESAPSEPEEE